MPQATPVRQLAGRTKKRPSVTGTKIPGHVFNLAEIPLAKARGTLKLAVMNKAEVLAELPRLTRQEREEIRLRIAELDGRMEITVRASAIAAPALDTAADFQPKRAARSAVKTDAEARWLEKLARRCGEMAESTLARGASGPTMRDQAAGFNGD